MAEAIDRHHYPYLSPLRPTTPRSSSTHGEAPSTPRRDHVFGVIDPASDPAAGSAKNKRIRKSLRSRRAYGPVQNMESLLAKMATRQLQPTIIISKALRTDTAGTNML